MAYPQPSGSFLHATLYSSLLLQVSRELFPTQPFFDLSPDKRRLVDQEAGNLLLQSKWKVDLLNSREAWEHLWGTPDHPRPPQEYPDTWKVWEQELLAPFLKNHPDAIRFTAYEELKGFGAV